MSHSKQFKRSDMLFHHGLPERESSLEDWILEDHNTYHDPTSSSSSNETTDIWVRMGTDGSLFFERLVIFCHTQEELSLVLQSFLRRRDRNVSPDRKIAIEECSELIRDILVNDDSVLEQNFLMKLFYRYFDTIFFMGSLKWLCEVRFEKSTPSWRTPVDGYTLTAEHLERDLIPDNKAALIGIVSGLNPTYGGRYENRNLRLLHYLSLLLHEMLHAYLSIFTCRCNEDCKHKNLEILVADDCGHRADWQFAAKELEIAATTFFGAKFDLKRREVFDRLREDRRKKFSDEEVDMLFPKAA